jgi:ABC-type branched-subunit amino acid transport system substrate-binding protein
MENPLNRRAAARNVMKRRTLLGMLAALPATSSFGAEKSGTFVLGQSAAFTGPAAQLGIQLNRGARLYFDQINAGGGVNGQRIELRTLDDGYEPDRCKANTEKLIDQNVNALFGYVGTPTSLAALPLVKESGIPFFAPFSGAMALRSPLVRNVFHVRASYDDETALIVNQLNHLGLKKIAVFRQDDSYGQAGLDGVKKALAALGSEPVVVSTVKRNSVDVAQAVKEIVPARPDAVVQIGAYKGCAAFIREARKAGYGGVFYNVSFVGTKALSDELGPEALGVVVSQVMPYPFSPAMPIVREYLAAVKAAGGDAQANYSSLEGYIDARVFVEGMRRAGRGSGADGLISGLESLGHTDFDGFNLHFGAREHMASRFVELSMLTGDGGVKR